jgi:DNA polymerase V
MPEVIILDSKPILDSLAVSLPYYEYSVQAGQSRFPSPAQDFVLGELKLDERLITNPPATVLTRATGDSMTGIGIYPGSILVVNKALKPKSSSIVIAVVDGEMMVKRLYRRNGVVKLLSENPFYAPIEFKEGQELIIWGVVTYVITAAT